MTFRFECLEVASEMQHNKSTQAAQIKLSRLWYSQEERQTVLPRISVVSAQPAASTISVGAFGLCR